MKILGVIPARGGSKGVPRKNLRLLGQKPLLDYTFEAVKESRLLTRVVLSTDDEVIKMLGEKAGIEVPFLRPAEFSRDETPSFEVVLHALRFFLNKGSSFDAVCLLQPTSPFRETGLIDRCIKKFQDGGTDSFVTVRQVPTQYNPHWCFEEREGNLFIATGEEKLIPRRQELPQAYHRDGAVYLSKSETILNKGSLYGRTIGFFEHNAPIYMNIDTLEDWKIAEAEVKNGTVQ